MSEMPIVGDKVVYIGHLRIKHTRIVVRIYLRQDRNPIYELENGYLIWDHEILDVYPAKSENAP